jgi:hypothetical protein
LGRRIKNEKKEVAAIAKKIIDNANKYGIPLKKKKKKTPNVWRFLKSRTIQNCPILIHFVTDIKIDSYFYIIILIL